MERNGNGNVKTLRPLETERGRRLYHLRNYFNLLLVNNPKVLPALFCEDTRDTLGRGNEVLVDVLLNGLRNSDGLEPTVYRSFVNEEGIMSFNKQTRVVGFFPFGEVELGHVILSPAEADLFAKLVDKAGRRVSMKEFSIRGSNMRTVVERLRTKLGSAIPGGVNLIENTKGKDRGSFYRFRMEPLSPELRAQR